MAIKRIPITETTSIICDKCECVLAKFVSEGKLEKIDMLEHAFILCQPCANQTGHFKIKINAA